jgi:hypothetical protein
MPSGGPRPPRLTSSKTIGYKTLVIEKDPDFAIRSQKVPEYEVTSNKKGGKRIFEGYYKARGPYAPS